MLITLTNIYSYVFDSAQCTKKSRTLELGEQLYMGEHIINCGLVAANEVEARCLTSKVSAPPHKIKIIFKDISAYKQWKCSCSCKAGAGEKCKHIVATLLYIYHATALAPLSCTDIEQKWGKRVQQRLVETIPLKEFCHVAPVEEVNCHDSTNIAQIMFKAFKAFPESEAASHLHQVRKPIDSESGRDFIRLYRESITEALIKPMQFFNNTWQTICRNAELSKFSQMLLDVNVQELKTCCITTYNKLYPGDAFHICRDTALNKEIWQEERKFRITGTRCYGLCTYSKNDWETKALKYFFPKSFAGNYATRYGENNEKFARAVYQSHLDNNEDVIEYGLAICQANPWLACSPDGIILADEKPVRLLEIKCPVIGSKKTIIECLPLLDYMKYTDKGFQLKKKHTYFAQVQLGMSILNLPMCDFILFSSYDNSIYVQKIELEEEFCTNMLTKLKQIFFNKMLHVLCDHIK